MRISDWSSDVCSSDLQAEDVDHLVDPRPPRGAVQTIDAGGKLQVLPHGQQTVERELLRHISKLAFGRAGRPAQVQPHHMRLAEIGRAAGRERVCPYV